MKDLEERVLEDFMDPNTNPRVWEARYTYFLNKKRAKLEVITKIIKE